MLIAKIESIGCTSLLLALVAFSPRVFPVRMGPVRFLQSGSQTRDFSGIDIRKNIPYLAPDRKEKLDMYRPEAVTSRQRHPGIVIIHGGGWKGGKKDDQREQNIALDLVRSGYVCVSIDYTLAREGNPAWPQVLYDCKTAVQFLRKFSDRYRVDPDHIGVIGGSAGGHLALMVGMTEPSSNLEPPQPYNSVSSRVQAVVDLYGPTNLLSWQWSQVPEIVPLLLGVSRAQDPNLWSLASPVDHVSSDDPPVLVIHGTLDTAVPLSQSQELQSKLAEKGVPHQFEVVEKAGHSFDLHPPSKRAPSSCGQFF